MADLMVDEVVLKNEEEISEWSDGLPVLLICAFLVVFDSGDVKDYDVDVIVELVLVIWCCCLPLEPAPAPPPPCPSLIA